MITNNAIASQSVQNKKKKYNNLRLTPVAWMSILIIMFWILVAVFAPA